MTNVPSNFSKSVCTVFCATFYQESSVFGTDDMYETCAKTFLEETSMCAPSFLVCTRLTACVCTHSLEGTLLMIRGNDNRSC